jgi:SHS2 domain-containing protein
MTYHFLEDVAIADMAFEIEAKSLSELLAEAAEALQKVQIENLGSIRPIERRTVGLLEANPEKLLHRFLEEIIFWKDAEQLLLLPESVDVQEQDGNFQLRAVLSGERLDPERHHQGVDVKAVTWHRFSVSRGPKGWGATIVLDV